MRTVRRQAAPLNRGKRQVLERVAGAYATEKQHWLQVFAQRSHRGLLRRHRVVRDAAVKAGYVPASGLQARMWKLALVDAAETWDKYWAALSDALRRKIARRPDYDDAMRHYAHWLLSGYSQFFACLEGQAPVPKFEIDAGRLPGIAAYIRRGVAKLRGRQPAVRKARSVVLDGDCYSVFVEKGTQYLSVMTLERGKRIALPLKGHAAISGNIRVVLVGDRVEVHVPQGLPRKTIEGGRTTAVDFGYTEAMTDVDGNAYGENLGRIITAASDERHAKGRVRNKLRDLEARYAASASSKKRAKAARIRRFNLGKAKWHRREERARAAIACEINAGLNRLIATQKPSVLVTEDLRHAFRFDKPKAWNRRLSSWARGTLQDRTEFKALAEGFRHEQVNPAYGSQACPACGHVESKNRAGDRFVCLHCKHSGHADRVAAMNYLDRLGDREITRYTPYRDVKAILDQRFHRRLEVEGVASAGPDMTVPGRTSDTDLAPPQVPARRMSQRGGREGGRSHPAVNRRAKQEKNAVAGNGE